MIDREDLGHPDQASHGARCRHCDEHHLLWRDASGPRRERVHAAGSQVKAEPAAVDDNAVTNPQQDGDHEHSTELATLNNVASEDLHQSVEVRHPARLRDHRRALVRIGRIVDRQRQQRGDNAAGRNEVEHDCRDHFVDTSGDLEEASEACPKTANGDGNEQDQRNVDRAPQIELRADPGRQKRRQDVLPLDANVEEVHLEPDRHSDTSDVERCRAVQDVNHRLQLRGGGEHLAVSIKPAASRQGEHKRRDEQRKCCRQRWRGERQAETAYQRCVHASVPSLADSEWP